MEVRVQNHVEFLARNGYRIHATPLEVFETTVNLAGENVEGDRKMVLARLERWIEERLAPVE